MLMEDESVWRIPVQNKYNMHINYSFEKRLFILKRDHGVKQDKTSIAICEIRFKYSTRPFCSRTLNFPRNIPFKTYSTAFMLRAAA